MPTSYFDQFYLIDPANPPLSGSILTVQAYELIDQNDNDFIESPGTDSIDGQDVTAVWPGDRLLLRIDGRVTVIRGTTFYLADGRAVFTPTDGKVLADAEFLDARLVTSESPMPVGSLGPPCLVAGTLVETARGRVPVEALRPGDRVRTRDHGLRPLLWRGATEDGKPGHPIVFDAALRPEFAELAGDGGGEVLVARHRDRQVLVRFADDIARRDLDTPEEWAAFRTETGL